MSINGHLSGPYILTSGVLQGSNLGPLLFVIFMNDIDSLIARKMLIYADNTKLYAEIRNIDNCRNLQGALNMFTKVVEDKGLIFNYDEFKTNTFRGKSKEKILYPYMVNKIIIKRETCSRDLGVIFDDKLTFIPQTRSVVSSASKALSFIMRITKKFENLKTMKQLYSALVRPKSEYAPVARAPYNNYQVKSIENIQRKFLKYYIFKLTSEYPMRY